MRKIFAAVTAFGALAGAQGLGRRFSPTPDHARTRQWYECLSKPSFTPPGPVFGVVWMGLDALIGYGGYRLLQAPPSEKRRIALWAWALSIAGIAGFPYVAFRERKLGEALGVSIGLIGTTGLAIGTASHVDRKAALSGLPLFGWLLFATLLQEELWRRNPTQAAPDA
ncbi:hypothetical protein NCH01_27250 [Neoasaia chiangmaiensis]|uniref:Uncharacterized protein n=1 Tax=Neoasaia chiangmaiensis TaxID=320497 RepID=A0A1U9KNX7_9PROT|nr:TspO/MBR family protein [Neoasaia chiangmaiensis]AQS87498.1 hypothetical protein A0U93_05605 [Neoasaia chiangmaiensis]GEN16294.1 hypothetical protein NCH01_27250 [Neoasaia chiangmaiensis]